MKKNIYKKKLIMFIIILIPLIIMSGLSLYNYYKEYNNIKIDEYNFSQLEKAKIILDKIPKDTKKFYTLKEFNTQYNADIKPIKNCYDVSNINWSESYMFWFKLYSKKYIKIYWTRYYAYPKYDLPVETVCVWECHDNNRAAFLYIISNPCNDDNGGIFPPYVEKEN